MAADAGPTAAVVFDLDGVLIDSEPVWEEVRAAFVAEHGGRWRQEDQRRVMGMSTPEWATYLSDELRVGMPADVAAEVIRRMGVRYEQQLPLLDGAVAAVQRLAARWPLGLASSSPRSLIDVVLQRAGLMPLFAATVSTEEVARGKPAPDVYLTVAGRLGVLVQRCAAVEDSSNGLRSAAAAGMRLIAIRHPRYPPDPDSLAAAGLVLDSLRDLTVEALEALR